MSNSLITIWEFMQRIVKVTRRGRTTIPVGFRRKYDIQEGDSLLLEDGGDRIVIHIIKKLKDLEGVDSEFGTPEQLKEEVEKLRKEYQ
ncbi:MAG: AbrB/MazE/SpoVT family DNA-binding domain-containing protein [Thermoplasmata archaeon]